MRITSAEKTARSTQCHYSRACRPALLSCCSISCVSTAIKKADVCVYI